MMLSQGRNFGAWLGADALRDLGEVERGGAIDALRDAGTGTIQHRTSQNRWVPHSDAEGYE